jgi:hypothetical protein
VDKFFFLSKKETKNLIWSLILISGYRGALRLQNITITILEYIPHEQISQKDSFITSGKTQSGLFLAYDFSLFQVSDSPEHSESLLSTTLTEENQNSAAENPHSYQEVTMKNSTSTNPVSNQNLSLSILPNQHFSSLLFRRNSQTSYSSSNSLSPLSNIQSLHDQDTPSSAILDTSGPSDEDSQLNLSSPRDIPTIPVAWVSKDIPLQKSFDCDFKFTSYPLNRDIPVDSSISQTDRSEFETVGSWVNPVVLGNFSIPMEQVNHQLEAITYRSPSLQDHTQSQSREENDRYCSQIPRHHYPSDQLLSNSNISSPSYNHPNHSNQLSSSVTSTQSWSESSVQHHSVQSLSQQAQSLPQRDHSVQSFGLTGPAPHSPTSTASTAIKVRSFYPVSGNEGSGMYVQLDKQRLIEWGIFNRADISFSIIFGGCQVLGKIMVTDPDNLNDVDLVSNESNSITIFATIPSIKATSTSPTSPSVSLHLRIGGNSGSLETCRFGDFVYLKGNATFIFISS